MLSIPLAITEKPNTTETRAATGLKYTRYPLPEGKHTMRGWMRWYRFSLF
jgi:hypothetical protein